MTAGVVDAGVTGFVPDVEDGVVGVVVGAATGAAGAGAGMDSQIPFLHF